MDIPTFISPDFVVSPSTFWVERRVLLGVIMAPAALNTRSDATLLAGQASFSRANSASCSHKSSSPADLQCGVAGCCPSMPPPAGLGPAPGLAAAGE